jgi:hypothetical protein
MGFTLPCFLGECYPESLADGIDDDLSIVVHAQGFELEGIDKATPSSTIRRWAWSDIEGYESSESPDSESMDIFDITIRGWGKYSFDCNGASTVIAALESCRPSCPICFSWLDPTGKLPEEVGLFTWGKGVAVVSSGGVWKMLEHWLWRDVDGIAGRDMGDEMDNFEFAVSDLGTFSFECNDYTVLKADFIEKKKAATIVPKMNVSNIVIRSPQTTPENNHRRLVANKLGLQSSPCSMNPEAHMVNVALIVSWFLTIERHWPLICAMCTRTKGARYFKHPRRAFH